MPRVGASLLSTQKGYPTPNPNSTENPKFDGSGPIRGPRGARNRARLAAQCRLHQKSAPQTNSYPMSRLSGKSSLWGSGFLGDYSFPPLVLICVRPEPFAG